MADARRFSPSTARNREPILDVLRAAFPGPPPARALEIACGSGEHGLFLAERLGVERWQPSDPDPDGRASVDAHAAHAGERRLLPAIDLDVTKAWPDEDFDLVLCINMIHISPWACTEGLMRGASRVLAKRKGVLYTYGPYRRNGSHTAPSNEAFDQSLRARDPSWGVRDLEAVVAEAAKNELFLRSVTPMPANNFSLVFDRS